MSYTSLSFDVSDALPDAITQGRRLSIAAWVFTPTEMAFVGGKPVVIALLNGGTYDKRYFHFEVPGETGYSCAEALRDQGFIVILLDHLGVGESSRAPSERLVTRQVAAPRSLPSPISLRSAAVTQWAGARQSPSKRTTQPMIAASSLALPRLAFT
jgi:alpha-beta hydrolase superfamily lysophospholipase